MSPVKNSPDRRLESDIGLQRNSQQSANNHSLRHSGSSMDRSTSNQTIESLTHTIETLTLSHSEASRAQNKDLVELAKAVTDVTASNREIGAVVKEMCRTHAQTIRSIEDQSRSIQRLVESLKESHQLQMQQQQQVQQQLSGSRCGSSNEAPPSLAYPYYNASAPQTSALMQPTFGTPQGPSYMPGNSGGPGLLPTPKIPPAGFANQSMLSANYLQQQQLARMPGFVGFGQQPNFALGGNPMAHQSGGYNANAVMMMGGGAPFDYTLNNDSADGAAMVGVRPEESFGGQEGFSQEDNEDYSYDPNEYYIMNEEEERQVLAHQRAVASGIKKEIGTPGGLGITSTTSTNNAQQPIGTQIPKTTAPFSFNFTLNPTSNAAVTPSPTVFGTAKTTLGSPSKGPLFGGPDSPRTRAGPIGGSPLKTNRSKRESESSAASGTADHYDPHYEPVIALPDLVEVHTGEEEERVLLALPLAKLYRWYDGQWKERGKGDVKILQNECTKKTRLVMRREQVHKVCANHYITSDMKLQSYDRKPMCWIWYAVDFSESDEEPTTEQFLMRFRSQEDANAFKDAFEGSAREQKTPVSSESSVKESSDGSVKPSGRPSMETPPTSGASPSQQKSKGPLFPSPHKSQEQPLEGEAKPLFGFGNKSILGKPPTSELGQSKENATSGSGGVFGGGHQKEATLFSFGPGSQQNTIQGFDSSRKETGSESSTNATKPLFSPPVISKPEETKPEKPKAKPVKKGTDQGGKVDGQPTAQNIFGNFTFGAGSKTTPDSKTVTPFGTGSTPVSDQKTPQQTSKHLVPTNTDEPKPVYKFDFCKRSEGFKGFAGAGTQLFGSPAGPPFGGSPERSGSRDNQGQDEDHAEAFEPDVDFKPVVELPELVELKTGEEDEKELFRERAKMYRFDKNADPPAFKERGVGDLKVLASKADGSKFRIVMRRDQVHKLCANHYINPDMNLLSMQKSDKAWTYVANDFSDGELQVSTLAVRFKDPEIAQRFQKIVDQCKKEIKTAAESENSGATSGKNEGSPKPPDGLFSSLMASSGAAKWECTLCLVLNDTSKEYCACCGADKSGNVPTNTGFGSGSFFATPNTTTTTAFGTPFSSSTQSSSSVSGFSFGLKSDSTPTKAVFGLSQSGGSESSGGGRQLFGRSSGTKVDRDTSDGSGTPLFGTSSSVASKREEGRKNSDASVQLLFESTVTPEQAAKAKMYQLPETFYLYEGKPPCSGCIGCEPESDGESPPEVDQQQS